MTDQEAAAERMLDALGHPTRREILQLLRIQPLAVGAIADHFPVSRPAISKHLRILHEAGLVAYQAEGASNIFHLQPARFQVLRHYLESFWTEALTNFQQVAVAQANTEKHQSGT